MAKQLDLHWMAPSIFAVLMCIPLWNFFVNCLLKNLCYWTYMIFP